MILPCPAQDMQRSCGPAAAAQPDAGRAGRPPGAADAIRLT
ncbi:MAG: hypothetical protein ACREFX_08555 [Opitutaceae bacterium]